MVGGSKQKDRKQLSQAIQKVESPSDEDPNASLNRHPELKFVEHSEGLPSAGTWIGYPLLFDFTGDGRADLVASNREEDGYNAWMAPEKGPWIRRIEGLPRENWLRQT